MVNLGGGRHKDHPCAPMPPESRWATNGLGLAKAFFIFFPKSCSSKVVHVVIVAVNRLIVGELVQSSSQLPRKVDFGH